MKIVQLTDLHLAFGTEDTMGIDIRQNFLDVVEAVRNEAPDFVVVTGDLCHTQGDKQVYEVIKFQLDSLGIPYSVISGNHDDSVLLAFSFAISQHLVGDELYYKLLLHDHSFLFLETSRGCVSDGQLAWLNKELSNSACDVIVFMHHPPVLSGVPFVDNNYALKNMEEVQRAFFGFSRNVFVYCGHCHVARTIYYNNMVVQITPSTYFQIDWRTNGFAVDHVQPGYRVINVREDGSITSAVVYLRMKR